MLNSERLRYAIHTHTFGTMNYTILVVRCGYSNFQTEMELMVIRLCSFHVPIIFCTHKFSRPKSSYIASTLLKIFVPKKKKNIKKNETKCLYTTLLNSRWGSHIKIILCMYAISVYGVWKSSDANFWICG